MSCCPCLFVIVIELLGIAIREDKSIEGIKLSELLEFLLALFADDVTSFLDMLNPGKHFLISVQSFGKITGFVLNYDKTVVYWLGSLRQSETLYYVEYGLFWTNKPFKMKGVIVGVEEDSKLPELNFQPLIKRIRSICSVWKYRDLYLRGKVTLVNALIASLFVYKLMVLLNIPGHMIEEIHRLIAKFVWSNHSS